MVQVTHNPPPGTPCWVDLGIPDVERARSFYGALFGWTFETGPPETGDYTMCMLNGRPVAALMTNPDEAATSFWWNLYLSSDDVDGTGKRIVDAHGRLVVEPTDVMDAGRMAVAVDPTGAPFGLWEGRAHVGAATVNEPGSMVWNELRTPRPELARQFYTDVFDYTLEPLADSTIDYTVLRRPDGHMIGGVHGEPGSTPLWLTYFAVDDTDAAVRRVIEAGGECVTGPWDSPYGRMAAVRDPFGAEFRLSTLPEAGSS